jgi:pimeloyl-ACP methyl ester carboxylesterase
MNQIELSAGTIDYQDTGGEGPTIVLLHGLLMDASLWDDVIADLSIDNRCVAPTLPLGAHGHPMSPNADLSLRGIAQLVAELIDRLDQTGESNHAQDHQFRLHLARRRHR